MTTYQCNICNEIKTEDLEPCESSYRKYGTWLMCSTCSAKRDDYLEAKQEAIEEFNREPD